MRCTLLTYRTGIYQFLAPDGAHQPAHVICADSCQFAHDGVCNEESAPHDGAMLPTVCENTCNFDSDSDCDDGGPDSAYSECTQPATSATGTLSPPRLCTFRLHMPATRRVWLFCG